MSGTVDWASVSRSPWCDQPNTSAFNVEFVPMVCTYVGPYVMACMAGSAGHSYCVLLLPSHMPIVLPHFAFHLFRQASTYVQLVSHSPTVRPRLIDADRRQREKEKGWPLVVFFGMYCRKATQHPTSTCLSWHPSISMCMQHMVQPCSQAPLHLFACHEIMGREPGISCDMH